MENRSFKKLNNKGFSLVELIVVVLIMGIIAGGVTVSVSVIYNASVSNASERLVQMCEKARSEALSRQDDSLRLVVYKSDGDFYADLTRLNSLGGTEVIATEKLGNSHIDICYINCTAAQEAYLNVSTAEKNYITSVEDDGTDARLVLAYNRSSGGILPQSGAGTANEKYVTDILIQGNDNADLILVHETGRVFIEQ